VDGVLARFLLLRYWIRCAASAAGNPAQEIDMNLNWLQLSSLQWHWMHELSQSALAAAVAVLGCVILLELASISRLRRAMDSHLQRVLEQLTLLRGENQRLMEAHGGTGLAATLQSTAPSVETPPAEAPVNAAVTPYTPPALGSGEARLLAALSAARARLARTESGAELAQGA
jgi:hypothetical protein